MQSTANAVHLDDGGAVSEVHFGVKKRQSDPAAGRRDRCTSE